MSRKKKRPRIGLFDIVVITLAIHDEESKAVDAYNFYIYLKETSLEV